MGLSKAGGGAAPASSSAGSGLAKVGGLLSSAGNIASGIQQGGVKGGLQAAGGAASLYNKVTGNSGGFSGLLGQAGSALNIYNGLTSGTPVGTVSGLASGAGLAASSGAASAAGASASTVAALGTAATGIGAVLAIPSVVSGVGDLIFGDLFGMNSADKHGNELGIIRNTPGSGVVERAPSSNNAQGGFASVGLGAGQASQGARDYYQGHDVTVALSYPENAQKASDLLKAGKMTEYNQFMQSLI